MKRILKEPLLHFLVLGAGMFLVYQHLPKGGSRTEPAQIVISQGQIEHLVSGFIKSQQHPPTPDELAGLIRDQVREEVYYREAMAMGLDRDDTIIRRRLRQKLEFISADIAATVEPTEADLQAYLQQHADLFIISPRVTFSQVYLNPDKHGAALPQHTAELLAQLNQAGDQADPAKVGDAFLLESQFTEVPVGEVAKQFGEKFAAQLPWLAPGQWQGPVESGYGVHLVRVTACTTARVPALAEVHDAVRREWDNARRRQANEEFYGNLLKRYTVTIEQPVATPEPAKQSPPVAMSRP